MGLFRKKNQCTTNICSQILVVETGFQYGIVVETVISIELNPTSITDRKNRARDRGSRAKGKRSQG